MGVKGQRKCCVCGKNFPSTLIYTIDAKNYCHVCGAELQKTRQKEIDANKKLNDYLYKLAGDKDLMPFWCKQIKSLKDDNGWKSEGILATLKYVFEIQGHPPIENPEFGIAWVVERYYYSAKKYHEQLYALKKTPDEVIQEILLMPAHEIVLKRSDLIKKDDSFLEKKKDLTYGPVLSMDDIEDDEEFYKEGDTE